MKKKLCLSLLFALTAIGCGGRPANDASSARPGMKRHAESGTCMATEVGPLHLQQEHEFGPADSGVSLSDSGTDLLVTLYTYPAGSRAPTDQEYSDHFRQVLAEVAQSMKANEFVVGRFKDPRFQRKGWLALTQGELNGAPVIAVVHLLTNDRWYFKVRATSPLAGDAEKTGNLTLAALSKSFNPCR